MKKLLVLLLVVLLAIFAFTGCAGIVTGEGEDEEEGEPETVKQVVLVEAFVATNCANCSVVMPHLDQLAEEYSRDEMILVELVPWGLYAIPEAKQRRAWYSVDKELSNILFNGGRLLWGNPNYAAIKSRIDTQLALTPKVSIQASRTKDGLTSIISGTIKNISDTTLSDLVINGMAFGKSGKFDYAACRIFEDEKVPLVSLAAGESKSFTITLEDINWDGFNLDGVIFVQFTTGDKSILQSLFIE
jgi:thiol-disulfide isomerase/thioredoxin